MASGSSSRDLLTNHALHHGLRPATVLRPAASIERDVLPLDAALAGVIDGGVMRGRSVVCSGDAAVALSMRVVARATQEGAWLAVVGVDDIGLLAAAEQGIALQRTVLVCAPRASREWAAAVATAIDGFALVMLQVPPSITVGEARKLMTRVQARRAVVVIVDPARQPAVISAFRPDVVLHTSTRQWFGIGNGVGHVQAREVRVEVSGRRMPGVAVHTVRLGC
jgi:hypothetical protein